jgi:YbbR domain-containing protein
MKIFRENLSLKVASLALAIGVWFFVRGEDRPVQIVSVPLEIRSLPEGLAIAGDVIDSVNVRVKAPEVMLKDMRPDRITARLDLSGLDAGDHLVRVRPEELRIPPGADVVKISPEYVAVRLEKKLTRELPVTPRVIGEPAAGFIVGAAMVRPDHVKVEGPESAVRLAKEVLTDIVRVDGRTTSVEVMVDLFPDRAGVRVLKEEPATLQAEIHEAAVTRVVPHVAVRADGGSRTLGFKPDSIEVTLQGPAEVLSQVSAGNLAAVVEIQRLHLTPGTYRIRPHIAFNPEGLASMLSVRSTSVPEIEVRVLPERSP